jgi:large subunit ribosomal protein L28
MEDVMSRVCDVCGKGPMYGNNVSHSHRKTRTRWEPNLKKVKASYKGKIGKMKICMSCLHAGKVDIIL